MLSQELREILPPLGSQRSVDEPMVYAKFWIPDVNWAWYVIEGENRRGDFQFFGYVVGLDEEWESFSLSDLKAVHSPNGGRVERDIDFTPTRWGSLKCRRNPQSRKFIAR